MSSNLEQHNDHQQRTTRYSRNHHRISSIEENPIKEPKPNKQGQNKDKTTECNISNNDVEKVTNNDYDR